MIRANNLQIQLQALAEYKKGAEQTMIKLQEKLALTESTMNQYKERAKSLESRLENFSQDQSSKEKASITKLTAKLEASDDQVIVFQKKLSDSLEECKALRIVSLTNEQTIKRQAALISELHEKLTSSVQEVGGRLSQIQTVESAMATVKHSEADIKKLMLDNQSLKEKVTSLLDENSSLRTELNRTRETKVVTRHDKHGKESIERGGQAAVVIQIESSAENSELGESKGLKDFKELIAKQQTEIKKLKSQLKVTELQKATEITGGESMPCGQKDDTERAGKEEIATLKTKIKSLEEQKKKIEADLRSVVEQHKDYEKLTGEIDRLKEKLTNRDGIIQTLREEIVEKKKQLAAEKKLVSKLKKQLKKLTKIDEPGVISRSSSSSEEGSHSSKEDNDDSDEGRRNERHETNTKSRRSERVTKRRRGGESSHQDEEQLAKRLIPSSKEALEIVSSHAYVSETKKLSGREKYSLRPHEQKGEYSVPYSNHVSDLKTSTQIPRFGFQESATIGNRKKAPLSHSTTKRIEITEKAIQHALETSINCGHTSIIKQLHITILELRTQLTQKTHQVVNYKTEFETLLPKMRSLNKEVEDAKKYLITMTENTSFAKSQVFVRGFSKMVERVATRKKREINSQEKVQAAQPDQTIPVTLERRKSHREDSLSEDSEGRFNFQSLVQYAEKKERDRLSGEDFRNNLLLHNLNQKWNKPAGIMVDENNEAHPTTGTGEKVPLFDVITHTIKKANPESRSISRTKNGNARKRIVSSKDRKKLSGTGSLVERIKGKLITKTRRTTKRNFVKTKASEGYLGKRSRSEFRRLQYDLSEVKHKNTTIIAERNLMNITGEADEEKPVFLDSAHKSDRRERRAVGRISSKKDSTPEPEKRKKLN